jgi:hypothetical protein
VSMSGGSCPALTRWHSITRDTLDRVQFVVAESFQEN